MDSWGSKNVYVGAILVVVLVVVLVVAGAYLIMVNRLPEGAESPAGSNEGPLTSEEKRRLLEEWVAVGTQLSSEEKRDMLERREVSPNDLSKEEKAGFLMQTSQ